MGTGEFGQNNPISITFPFEPILLIGPNTHNTLRRNTVIICNEIDNTENGNYYWLENSQVAMKKSDDKKTIS